MIDFHCFAGRSQAAVSWPCLPWVGIQLRWMEMLWCSSIRRQAFQWPCPLMHYKWAHSHLPRDMWSTWDTAERCFLSSSKEQPISRGLASRKPRDAAVQTTRPKNYCRHQRRSSTLQLKPQTRILKLVHVSYFDWGMKNNRSSEVLYVITCLKYPWVWKQKSLHEIFIVFLTSERCHMIGCHASFLRFWVAHTVTSLIWLLEPYQSLDSGILSPGIKQKGKSCPFHLLQSYSDNTFDVWSKNSQLKHCCTLKLLVVQPQLRIHLMFW